MFIATLSVFFFLAQDSRTVNVIATALLADTPKLACTALNFFLNIDTQMADDDDEEGKAETALSEVIHVFSCCSF